MCAHKHIYLVDNEKKTEKVVTDAALPLKAARPANHFRL